MKIRLKTSASAIAVLAMSIMLAAPAFAGNLEAPGGAPTATGVGAMFTLEDIYQRLENGTAGTKRGGPFAEPGAGPVAGTGHTLDQVMGIAPALDNANGAGLEDVLTGKTFWGLTDGAWGLQTGTGAAGTSAALVPATGDPADTTGVALPSPRFTINDNRTPDDQSDDTVTDNFTGLMWTRNADTADGKKNWAGAKTFCDGLTLGGHDDWRLPTLREMQSLCHYGYFNPAVSNAKGDGQATEDSATDGDPFNNLMSYYYWTSTTYSYNTSYSSWYVNLNGGNVGNGVKTNAYYYVWPVRGGQ